MDENKLIDIKMQLRWSYKLMGEVMDLSHQLADALDRSDQVAVRMLLGMRNEPIEKLVAAKNAVQELLEDMEPRQAQHTRDILNGAPARYEQEKELAAQTAANDRLLKQLQEIDKRLNLKLTHEESIYS